MSDKTIKKDLHGLVDKVYDHLVDMTIEAINDKVASGNGTMDMLGNTVTEGDYVVAGKESWIAALVIYHIHKVSKASVFCTLVRSKARAKKEYVFRTTSVVKVDAQSVLFYKLTK